MTNNFTSAEELVELIRGFAEECNDSDACKDCQVSGFCDKGWTPEETAKLIEHLAWMACKNCEVCQTEGGKNPLDCEIIGTEVEI